MTNLYFDKYTGSELHILEMARLFEKRGYEVTIAVFQKAYPLLEMVGTINVVDVLNEELNEQDFDIIFVQHYPVLDFLCCKYKLSYKKLVVSKLSVISELEYLPSCTSEADLILCVSQECANEVYKETGHDTRVRVFNNSVTEEFFNAIDIDEKKTQLKKIAVISNHVPQELLDLASLLDKEYTIDYIGLGYSPTLVDASLLKQYDLVITIGRTVQQCFALGIPVYVYDYFGGPGYIDDDNFSIAEENNFSGRGGFRQKSSLELKDDIFEKYENNCSNLKKLHTIAQERYSYAKNFEGIYQKLLGDDREEKKILACYKNVEKQRMALYSKVVPLYALSPCVESQLYINFGQGYNENDSIKWKATDSYNITKKIKLDRRVKGLRFDPCNVPAKCFICKIYINGKEKIDYSKKQIEFLGFDPQMEIELSKEEKKCDELLIEIVYKVNSLSWQDTMDIYQKKNAELQKKCNDSKKQIEDLKKENEKMKERYTVAPEETRRKIFDVFRR